MGVPEGEDFASYEMEIPVSVVDLKPIMGGPRTMTAYMTTKLAADQISAIEQRCTLKFPTDLMLFLTCNA